MTTKCRNRIVTLGIGGVQNDVFEGWRPWRGLVSDTYELKLFGMHIGSVLSGLEAGNVNNDHKMPILSCKNTHWKGKICNFFEIRGLAGDLNKDTYEANLVHMHIGSVLSGLDAQRPR